MPADTICQDTSVSCAHCPVVILIGIQTGALCEDFLIDLYEVVGRPLFIREQTQGPTGAPYVFICRMAVPDTFVLAEYRFLIAEHLS